MPSLQLAKNPDYTQRRFSLLGSSFLRHRPFRTGETNLGLRSVFETAIDLSFGHAQPVIVLHNFVIQLNSCTSADRPGRAQFDPLEGQVYYVPDEPGSGRTTLNRLINAGGTNQADAISNLSGYSSGHGYWISLNQPLRFRCGAMGRVLEQ